MRKIKRFNESKDQITSEMILDGLKNGTIKNNIGDKYLDDYLKDYSPLRIGTIRNNLAYINVDQAVLYIDDSGIPKAFISEYEAMNPFIFSGVVIVPGHDSITCYDIETEEIESFFIR